MQKQEKDDGRGFLAFVKVWAVTLYLPLRTGMGCDHLGFSLVFGLFLMWIVGEFSRSSTLLWLFVVDLIACVIGLFNREVRRWRGVVEHSEYGGRSWLLEWFFGEEGAKQFGEPLLSIFVGWLIYRFSPDPNAATYFWYGAVCLAVFQASATTHYHQVHRQMTNAMIEHQHFTSRMRRRL